MQTPGTRRAVRVLHGGLAWSRGECRTGGSRLCNSWLTIGFEASCLCDTVFTSTPKWLTFFPHLERPLNVLYSHVFERTVASIEAVSTYRRGVVDLLIIIEKSEVFSTLLHSPAGPRRPAALTGAQAATQAAMGEAGTARVGQEAGTASRAEA